jgi:hypothetical protein
MVLLMIATEYTGPPDATAPCGQPSPHRHRKSFESMYLSLRILQRAGFTGHVTERLAVNPDGVVANSSIVKSLFHEFEASGFTATKSWLFRTLPDAQASDEQRLVIDYGIKFPLAKQ